MKTVLTGLLTLGACGALRRRLAEEERADAEYAGGRVRVTRLWNDAAAFGLQIPRGILTAVSSAALTLLWIRRKEHPISAGLVLGGGLSNLLERLLKGKVLDYVQFPKAAGRLKKYVFNLADFAIFLGCAGLFLHRRK